MYPLLLTCSPIANMLDDIQQKLCTHIGKMILMYVLTYKIHSSMQMIFNFVLVRPTNMFGQGTNLVLKSLSSGKLVSNLKMYGIIVAAHKPDEARLLQVNIDFEEQTCVVRRVTRTMVTEHNSRSIGREGQATRNYSQVCLLDMFKW